MTQQPDREDVATQIMTTARECLAAQMFAAARYARRDRPRLTTVR